MQTSPSQDTITDRRRSMIRALNPTWRILFEGSSRNIIEENQQASNLREPLLGQEEEANQRSEIV